MRAFASIPPTIWQVEVKKLRGDAQAIAIYFHLLTSQHSNMTGVYPLAVGYMALDLGLPLEGAQEGLRRVCDSGLATYDAEREFIWVHDMAIAQIAPRLAPKDNRVTAVAKQLALLPICPITLGFYERYRELFHLGDHALMQDYERAFKGGSEPLRSKDKEQDKRQDQDKNKYENKNKNQDLGQETEKSGFGNKGGLNMRAPEIDECEEPYGQPATLQHSWKFLIDIGVPDQFLEQAQQRHMAGMLYPCDVENWKAEIKKPFEVDEILDMNDDTIWKNNL